VAAEALEAGLGGDVSAAHVLQADMVQPGGQSRPVPVAHQADEPLQVAQVLPAPVIQLNEHSLSIWSEIDN
jgi:hypothetical protein